jgi:hypothetical protein
MAIGVIAALAATLCWVILHLVAMHIRPAQRRMLAMTRAFLLALPLVPALVFAIGRNPEWRAALAGIEHPAAAYGMGLLLHVLFYFCFVECFYHVERAVTLRMVIEILEHPGGPPTVEALLNTYPVDDMVRRRLEGMRDAGFVLEKNGRWMLTRKGRFFASAMRISSVIFNSKPQHERMP